MLGVNGMEAGLGAGSYRTFKSAERLNAAKDLPYWASLFERAFGLEGR